MKMAKRSGTNDRFGGSLNHKKPKLDISVQKRNEFNYGASTSSNHASNIKKPNSNPLPVNLWNDDDDEDLLVISQMVENKIQSNDICTRTTNSDMFNNISITFERFGQNVQSSTQLTSVKPKPNQIEPIHIEESSSLFDDCFDFEWENDNFKNGNKKNENDMFKVPSIQNKLSKPVQSQFKNDRVQPKLMSMENDNVSSLQREFSNSNSSDRQQDAIQIDKLIQRLDTLQDENKKQTLQINTLSEQINDLNEKIQTREGEASVLRHELRSSKQGLDTLRLQKISENDTIRQEYQNKISELERTRNVIQAELNQKKIENIQLKQKNAIDGNATEIIRKYQDLSEINKLNFRFEHNLSVLDDVPEFPNEIFTESDKQNNNIIESYFQNQFEELRSIVIEWNVTKYYETHIIKIKTIFTDVIQNLIKFLKLNSSKYNETRKGNSFDILESLDPNCTLCLRKNIKKQNILFADKISEFEKIIPFRRFIGIMSYILKNIPEFKRNILEFITETLNSSETNIEIILKLITSSSNLNSYRGILESICLVLTSLAKVGNFVENYVKYFNIVTHCAPDLRVMAEILDCLQEISKNKFYLDKMCKKSPKFKILYTGNKKIIKVPNSGCILQTFCTIMDYRIQKQEQYLFKNKFELLRILENYVKLLGNCFKHYPIYMYNPNLSDFNLSDSNTRNCYDINHGICNCYALVCCSLIFVFKQFLKFWSENQNSFDLNNICETFRTASILLCDIFDSYYQPVIVFIGNTSVKQNLTIILNCLEDNKIILKIDYENILNIIKNSSIFTDTDLSREDCKEINKINAEKIIDRIFLKDSFF